MFIVCLNAPNVSSFFLIPQESLEPLGLRELCRLRIKGTNPARCGGESRPQTHHGVRLPSLTSVGDGEHRHESRSRKKTWPISVSMLKSIV